MNNPEIVTVIAGGVPYAGWTEVNIEYSIKEATRSFDLATTERSILFASEWSFPPGTPIKVLANGSLVVDGYVNVYHPSINPTTHPIQVRGRGKGQDFVDCAAVHPTGHWEKKTPAQIARDLDHFGIGIVEKVPGEPIDYHQLYQGETAFEAVERANRQQGLVMRGAADGTIEVTNAKAAGRHAGAILEGVHGIDLSAEISDQDRYSETTVKGQRRHGTTEQDLRVKETAKDPGVKRYRPRVLVAETDTDQGRARKRAEHERNRAQGFSVKATAVVQGWRDDAGELWDTNRLIYVFSPALKIKGDMLIESVQLNQGRSGSKATLQLVNAKAYDGDGGTSGSSKEWG